MTTPTKTSKRRNEGAAVRLEPRASTVLQWDPAKIVLARQRCTLGDFSLFSDLCEAMMPDDRVSKCLETLFSATTLPLTFQLPGKDSKQSATDPCVQALDADWWKVLPEQKVRAIMAWLGLSNACLMHVDGWESDPDTGRVIPQVKVWSLRNLRNDIELGIVVRSTTSTSDSWGVEEPIIPGDGNWVLLLAGDSWKCIGQARGHGVALFWLLKQYAIVDWALSSERHGGGVNVARAVTEWAANLTPQSRSALAADMAAMARNGNIVLPPGWTYELVTDAANSYQTFEAQIKAADTGNTIGILGTNLTTEVTGGSFAAAGVHASMDAGRMRGLLELLATGLREQLWVYWAAFNNASWKCPYAKWDTTPPVDKKALGEARKADAEALLTYRKAGAQLNQKAWFEGRVELLKSASEEFPELQAGTASPTNLRAYREAPRGHVHASAKPTKSLAFERGLDYTGRVEESLRGHAAKLLAPDVAAVLAAVEGANNYSEAREAIERAYLDRVPASQLCRLTEAAMIMCQFAGAESVEQEFSEE